jgi:glycosyltransferase involved in cell wall biosynthesis
MVLGTRKDEKKLRMLAERYDWRTISQQYEKVLEGALGEWASK